MKKLNWGNKIAIGASTYVIGILIFVGFSTTQKINLVSKDYYPKEIKYQDQIEKIKNTNALKEKILVTQENGTLQLQFPNEIEGAIQGEIVFYRPSDYEMDVKLKIALNQDNTQNINTDNLLSGRYNVKIEWSTEGKEYFQEEAIFVTK
ncbi:MAG: FixH family protein [Marinifilaceae bacterium]